MNIPPLVRALLGVAAAQGCVCAQAPIAVAVFNYTAMPRSPIVQAAKAAQAAFHSAGIETRWIVCDSPAAWRQNCTQPLPADDRYLELLVTPKQLAPLPGSATALHPAGYAMVGTGLVRPRAYAFLDATKAIADRTERSLPLVLSCVLVHEAGHLLGLPHQPHGAMRANLDAQEMDSIAMGRAFSPDEVKHLREASSRSGPSR